MRGFPLNLGHFCCVNIWLDFENTDARFCLNHHTYVGEACVHTLVLVTLLTSLSLTSEESEFRLGVVTAAVWV